MSDEACCACLKVMYLTKRVENGQTIGWWECRDCGNKFISERLAEYRTREAVRVALKAVCVKKLEAEPMSGELEGAVLEEALKSDAKAKELGDPGTRHTGPRPTAPDPIKQLLARGLERDSDRAGEIARGKFVPPESSPTEGDLPAPSAASIKEWAKNLAEDSVKAGEREYGEPKPPTQDLPAGMKMVLWVPIQNHGETLFQCSVEGFGLRATQMSRSKQKALAYCLEDLARQMIEADRG